MKKSRRVLALSLAVVLILGVLSSCGETAPDADKIIAAAEDAMDSGIYSATVTTEIDSAREDISSALEGLEKSDITIAVNGKSFKMDMELSTSGVGIVKSFTAHGGTLYALTEITVGDASASEKKKAELGSEAVAELLAALGAGADVGYDDFASATLVGEDGEYEIVCSQMKADAMASLGSMMESGFAGSEVGATLTDATYTIVIENGMYKSTSLTASYAILEPNDAYTVTMTVTTEYEYGTAPKIDAPADANDYESVSLDSIV